MDSYLGLYDVEFPTKEIVDQLMEKHLITKIVRTRTNVTDERFSFNFPGTSHLFNLSGFPGNCSVLVLSEIQHAFLSSSIPTKESFESCLNFCFDICTQLGYAGLFVSTTSDKLIKFLSTFGFESVYDNINPHSNNKNDFMIKRFSYEEPT